MILTLTTALMSAQVLAAGNNMQERRLDGYYWSYNYKKCVNSDYSQVDYSFKNATSCNAADTNLSRSTQKLVGSIVGTLGTLLIFCVLFCICNCIGLCCFTVCFASRHKLKTVIMKHHSHQQNVNVTSRPMMQPQLLET